MARNGANAKLEEFIVDTISIPDYFNAHLLGTKEGLTRLVDAAGSASCCPFHDDVNPSFRYWKVKKFFNCFGCGVSGDVINLHRLTLQRKNNVRVTRDAALMDLCRLYNIKLPERASTRPTMMPVRTSTIGANGALGVANGANAADGALGVANGANATSGANAVSEANVASGANVANAPNTINGAAPTTNATQPTAPVASTGEGITSTAADESTAPKPEIQIPAWVIDPNESVFERCRKQVQGYSAAMQSNRQKFNMLDYREQNNAILESDRTLAEKFAAFAELDAKAGIEISMTADKLETAAKMTATDIGSLF